MAIQPLGCCFVGCVLRLCLLVASVPGSPAGGRDGAFLMLDLVVCCSSTSGAVFEFWRPGPSVGPQFALLSGNWKTSAVFLGFSRLWIRFSSSHCWSILHWRHLSVVRPASAGGCYLWPLGWRLQFSAAAADSRTGMVCRLSSPPSGVEDGDVSVPLMLCASTGIYFRSILASSRLSLLWVFSGLV